MAPLRSIYDEYFRILVAKQEIGVEDNLREEVDFVFPNPCHNIQKERSDDHVQYDVFGSKDMKGMTKVLGDNMKRGAGGHVLRSAIQFALRYKALAFGKRRVRQ